MQEPTLPHPLDILHRCIRLLTSEDMLQDNMVPCFNFCFTAGPIDMMSVFL